MTLDSIDSIGLTAGASTPEQFIDVIVQALKVRGFGRVETMAAETEDVHFSLPPKLK